MGTPHQQVWGRRHSQGLSVSVRAVEGDRVARIVRRRLVGQVVLRGRLAELQPSVAEVELRVGEDIIELCRPDNRRAEDVGDLAERLAVSERTLQRLARHYIGVSPAALLRHRRLQAAADGYAVGPC